MARRVLGEEGESDEECECECEKEDERKALFDSPKIVVVKITKLLL